VNFGISALRIVNPTALRSTCIGSTTKLIVQHPIKSAPFLTIDGGLCRSGDRYELSTTFRWDKELRMLDGYGPPTSAVAIWNVDWEDAVHREIVRLSIAGVDPRNKPCFPSNPSHSHDHRQFFYC
jgi:hypothetical protein